MQEVLKVAFDRADESGASVEHADGRTCRYEDPSGATLTIHVDRRGGFECCQPGFAGPSRSRWRPLQVVPDPDGCRFCDLVYAQLLDDEDEELYPFAVRIETMAASRELIPYGDPGEVGFVGLWEEGRVWPDGATFDTCVAPGILEHEELLVPGAVAGGTLWLVGRPLTLRDAPGPVPTAEEKPRSGGLLGRFFGRR